MPSYLNAHPDDTAVSHPVSRRMRSCESTHPRLPPPAHPLASRALCPVGPGPHPEPRSKNGCQGSPIHSQNGLPWVGEELLRMPEELMLVKRYAPQSGL